MEELIMKMHEEAMDLQQAVTTMRGILDELRDMICAEDAELQKTHTTTNAMSKEQH